MDIQMPEMDGYKATQIIRAFSLERAKSIPIIAMTANVFREDIEKCLAAGMNDHTGKPINTNDLFKKINKYITSAVIDEENLVGGHTQNLDTGNTSETGEK
jgi:CheY-like chemotaxis protein